MFKQNINYASILVFLVVITLPQYMLSQTKHTVILPDTDKAMPVEEQNNLHVAANAEGEKTSKSFFKFNFNYLPQHIIIEKYGLKLYNYPRTDEFSKFSTQKIRGFHAPESNWPNIKDNKSLGKSTVKKSTTSITMNLNKNRLNKDNTTRIPNGILSLGISSSSKEQSTKFYSTTTAENQNKFTKKSKLLLEYEVEYYPFNSNWSQPRGNAQHKGALNWSTAEEITEAKVQVLPNEFNDYMDGVTTTGTLAIYKNQPLVFTRSRSGTSVFKVKQLDGKGKVLWEKAVDGAAKCWPLIDAKGRLYYISTANTLTVLDLNKSGAQLFSKSLATITNSAITTTNNNATIGYDGTLYLTSSEGTVALSAYPQLKVRWKYKSESNESNGTVSLSEDESRAFFINVNKTQGKSRLIVLDNNDGTPLIKSNYLFGSYANDGGNYHIPAPIIQDGKDLLGRSYYTAFVLNGFLSSNALFIFKIKDQEITETNEINGGNSNNTGISQPVIDPKGNVFFVYNGKMARYIKGDDKKTFNGNTYNLDNASILVTDAASNIYVMDPYDKHNKDPQKLFGFKYDKETFKQTFSTSFDKDRVGNLKKNLVLAPDGILYTVTINNVIAIRPKMVSKSNLQLSKLNRNTVYRATNTITVEGFKMLSTVNTILYSGKGVSFQKGFSVENGAELTVKTGY